MCVYVQNSVHMYAYIYREREICMYVCIYKYMCIYIYTCAYTHVCIYMYTYIDTCMCTYIYIHICWSYRWIICVKCAIYLNTSPCTPFNHMCALPTLCQTLFLQAAEAISSWKLAQSWFHVATSLRAAMLASAHWSKSKNCRNQENTTGWPSSILPSRVFPNVCVCVRLHAVQHLLWTIDSRTIASLQTQHHKTMFHATELAPQGPSQCHSLNFFAQTSERLPCTVGLATVLHTRDRCCLKTECVVPKQNQKQNRQPDSWLTWLADFLGST